MTEVPRIELRGIRKAFPGVQALDGVDLVLCKGEVHALVGENGAGKSTLIKVIGGVYRADEGTYLVDGKPNVVSDPRSAADAGIRVVYQELELVPDLSVAENVFFGRLPVRGGIRVDWRRLEQDTRAALDQVGLDVSPRAKVRRLGIAQQQLVEIARALSHQARSLTARVLVLDEPTSALSIGETRKVLGYARAARDRGLGVVFITHNLHHVFEVADRLTILSHGRKLGDFPRADLTPDTAAQLIMGEQVHTQL